MTTREAPSISAQVLRYVEEHVGLSLTAFDIKDETGLPIQQIQNVMYKLPKLNPGIEKVGRGVYRYMGPNWRNNKESMLFELVGTTKQGKLVLQDEEGKTLYIAEELDL